MLFPLPVSGFMLLLKGVESGVSLNLVKQRAFQYWQRMEYGVSIEGLFAF